MNKLFSFIFSILLFFLFSCTEEWQYHYENEPQSVNVKMWDTLQTMENYSEFVKYAQIFKLDTFIKSSNTKTLFIPDNDAFAIFLEGDTAGFVETMRYHITPTLFMLRNVKDKYKLQTLEKKYALISNFNDEYYFDDIRIGYSSPFFLDGKYYETDSVVIPKPNLYQYLTRNNPSIKRYIDTQDSIILDREKSKPIAFNDEGQTIYDSVTTVINLYEQEYFAVSEEYADISATLVLPQQSDYDEALDEMAQQIGGIYQSHEDIPVEWQNEVFVPILLNKGTYGGLLDPEDFLKEKITNIRGDSIKVDFEIDPFSRFIASNGIVYNYSTFSVGDSLYKENIIEGEDIVEPIGLGNYVWDEEFVSLEGNQTFQPTEQGLRGSSNDTIINVQFTNNFQGRYDLTIRMKHVFPGNYRLVWRTNYRTTGLYSIYVNGEKITLGLVEYEEFDTYNLRSGFFSVLGYKLYPDESGFCSVDALVEVAEYGDILIMFEYKGPGQAKDNGFSMDYIELLPE